MKGKKRPAKKVPFRPADPNSDVASGSRCVYCGKPVAQDRPPFLAQARTRRFPVCSEACRGSVERYVLLDQQRKKFLYLGLFFCAVLVLISALWGSNFYLMSAAVILGGAAFLAFPFPITSFETFLGCSIRTVNRICRVVGAVLLLAGILLLSLKLMGM